MLRKHQMLLFIITELLSNVFSVPISPCPRNFHYEYDGQQWIGVVNVYPKVYNVFRTNKITMVIILMMNGQIPDNQNVGSLDLFKSITETYQDIAMRQSIIYQINFPTRYISPIVLEILVNNVRICSNLLPKQNMIGVYSKIQLQHSFHLPIIDADLDQQLDFQYPLRQDHLPSLSHFNQLFHIPEIVSPLHQIPLTDDTIKENQLTLDSIQSKDITCGKYDDQFRLTHLISGGEKISHGTWPWLVAIFLKEVSGVNFQCTGNLLSNKVVLTAAHCFQLYSKMQQKQPNEILLAFGRYNLRDWTESDTILSDVEKIILHPDYMAKDQMHNYDADISILITKQFINFSAFIKPICLWPADVSSLAENTNDILGLVGTLVGWGLPNENLGPNIPRKLNLPIVSKDACFPPRGMRTTMSSSDNTNKRVFCAGSANVNGPCNGDSGSGIALWQNGAWFLRGLVSAAIGDPILNRCELNTFVIFTDITKFRTWIDSFL